MGGSRKGARAPAAVRVKRAGGGGGGGGGADGAGRGEAGAGGVQPGSPLPSRAPAVLDRTNSEERERERDLAHQRSREARERMEREGPIGEEDEESSPDAPQFTSEMSFEALWKAVRSSEEMAFAEPSRFRESQAFPVAAHMGMGGLLLEILMEDGGEDGGGNEEDSYNQLTFPLETVTRFQATEAGFFFETAGEDGELTLHLLQSTPVAIHCAKEALQVSIRLAVREREDRRGGEARSGGEGEQAEPASLALLTTESLWTKATTLPIQLATSLLGMNLGEDGAGLSREPSLERGNARPLTSI